MARKVFVSSDMSVDERLIDVAERDANAALLWPWMLTAFDDWGRAEAAPKRLKAKVFPSVSTVSPPDIERALELFADAGLVQLYQVEDKPYMAIPPDKWFKYQTHIRASKRDNDGSRYPPPPDSNSAQSRATARNDAQQRAVDSKCEPSPSPSPSPSPTKDIDDADIAPPVERAREPDHPDKTECLRLVNTLRLEWPLSGDPWIRFLEYADRLSWTLCLAAVRKTLAESARSINYCLAILERWDKTGIRTLEEVAALDAEHERNKQRKAPGGQRQTKDRPKSNVFLKQDQADKSGGYYDFLHEPEQGDDP